MKIAIMGYGTVGSGVAEVIDTHEKSLAKSTGGENMEVARILDLRDFPGDKHEAALTKDFNDILNDKEIKVVAETMGGVNPAFDFTMKLLKAGKSVVTSNTELVAQKGLELLEAAKENGVNYLFEASVGGGIPIIRPLYSSLLANELTQVIGILNGTTNYILTQMIKNGESFADALKGAQEKGYAEKDPTADIEGYDTCRKIAILASLAFGKYVCSDEIPTEGITQITLEDVSYAAEIDRVIKLVGMTNKVEDGVFARVCPVMLKREHPLAGIDDVFNGIMVKGKGLGDVMFYGRGAGALPTASAVVSDVIEIVKNKGEHIRLGWGEGTEGYLKDGDLQEFRFYVRLSGAPARVSAFQKEGFRVITLDGEQYKDEFAIVTPKMNEKAFIDFQQKMLSDFEIRGRIRLVEE